MSKPCPPGARPPPTVIVKVLLVGFRRLARYAAEDSLSRCGKLIIRASDQAVATKEPAMLLDSHLILLYAPPEKTIRQIFLLVPRTPTAVIASDRYKNTADVKLRDLLNATRFLCDPMQIDHAKSLYELACRYASGGQPPPDKAPGSHATLSLPAPDDVSAAPARTVSDSPARKPFLDGDPSPSCRPIIELEDIDDEDDVRVLNGLRDRSHVDAPLRKSAKVKVVGISELLGRLNDRRGHRSSRSFAEFTDDMSMHSLNKLRAERVAIGNAFRDLGGYATLDSCAALARACGLAKCAGPLLFRAAFGSSCEVEAMTPEAGVPNAPMDRMKRISADAFVAYWDSRLKVYDGEDRLIRILEDSHAMRMHGAMSSEDVGHSQFGARPSPKLGVAGIDRRSMSLDGLKLRSLESVPSGRLFGRGSECDYGSYMPSDVSVPCDAGIEDLIRSFMEGRSSRFGTYALVKMAEAIAVGAALVMHEIRAVSSNRVGGQARPVCPKEVRESKLNAALMAAEVGIFEGVASGLSMNHIRSVKGCFATEVTPGRFAHSAGCALSVSLSVEEVQHFCVSRKTLLPGAARRAMYVHCRDAVRMTLSEFSILLHILNDITTDGAMDYFFSVVDVDQNDEWTLPDLREFHREKESLWQEDGMAVNDLHDVWFNLVDMVGSRVGRRKRAGVTRRDLMSLGVKDRKAVLQSLLYVDDECSSLNIRRTMELNKNNNNKSSIEVV